MYKLPEDLMLEIQAGEDTYMEFKEVVIKGSQVRFASEEGKAPAVIAEVFVSMANTEGGTVLFGVDKHGGIVGVPEDKRDLLEQFVINRAINNCEPRGSIEPVLNWRYLPDSESSNRLILQADIEKSRFYVHCTKDGRYLKRVGSHRAIIPAEQLGRLLAVRNLLIPFEERPCPNADLNDFDTERFGDYYYNRFNQAYSQLGIPLERLLGNIKLAVEMEDGIFKLSNLGVLLFTKRPDSWLPGVFIEISVYDGVIADGNTIDNKRLYGPITRQIENAIEYLKLSPQVSTLSRKGEWGRLDRPRYSLLALQEGIVNAVVHRDYELTGSQILLNIFTDRIEIRSPGPLHNTLKPEDLYMGCQPMRRNQHLVGFLRDYNSPVTGHSLMEVRGEGFLNLVRESVKVSGIEPRIEMIGQSVKLTIFTFYGLEF